MVDVMNITRNIVNVAKNRCMRFLFFSKLYNISTQFKHINSLSTLHGIHNLTRLYLCWYAAAAANGNCVRQDKKKVTQ